MRMPRIVLTPELEIAIRRRLGAVLDALRSVRAKPDAATHDEELAELVAVEVMGKLIGGALGAELGDRVRVRAAIAALELHSAIILEGDERDAALVAATRPKAKA